MNFHCEDLQSAGLVLVPPSSPDCQPLLKDIQDRIDHPSREVAAIPEQIRSFIVGKISPEKRDTSAILLNRSGKSIAALELVWRFEDADGRSYAHPWMNTFGKALLLPSKSGRAAPDPAARIGFRGPVLTRSLSYWMECFSRTASLSDPINLGFGKGSLPRQTPGWTWQNRA